MDASGSLYHLFSNHDNPTAEDSQHDGTEPSQCSPHGCALIVTGGSNNKMCDTCRSRHRVYATTKRAKQKLEKASGTEATQTDLAVPEASSQLPSTPRQLEWVVNTGEQYQEARPHARQASTAEPSHEESPLVTTWQTTVDRITEHVGTTCSMLTLDFSMSSSSTLANALSFPGTGNSYERVMTSSHEGEKAAIEDSKPQGGSPSASSLPENSPTISAAADSADASQATTEDPSALTRVCTVKGCKALIPDSYEFKMCPPCRERYRIYGNTKRAKWKHEREAFEGEMASLCTIEDEKRKARGLGPLSDNLDELRAWELSVVDEEIPMPDGVPSSSTSPGDDLAITLSEATKPIITTPALTPPAAISSSAIMASLHAAVMPSMNPISTYAPLNGTDLADAASPYPARMCTVSHCHKILPGSYRYKRCEQHRLQNRNHSTLKCGRPKEKKSVKSEDSRVAKDATAREIQSGESSAPRVGVNTEAKTQAKEILVESNSTSNIVNTVANVATVLQEKGSGRTNEVDPIESASSKGLPAPVKNQRGPKHVCGTSGCHNLLVPNQRWRTCDICRATERDRRLAVREQLKAAESIYWKGVAKNMSAARKLEKSNAVASGSGPTGLSYHTPASGDAEKESNSLMDTDMDAEGEVDDGEDITGEVEENEDDKGPEVDPDADGESTSDANETHVVTLAGNEEPHSGFTTSEGRVLIWQTKKPETSTQLWSSGFSKFRVAIPSPHVPTTEQSMKFNDLRSFRAYTPTTAPSAIGRILARNPQLSVEAFSEILVAESSQVNDAVISQQQVKNIPPKHIPTPTIPVSAPFVYKAPTKNQVSTPTHPEMKPSSASKGKCKATSYTPMSNTHPIIPVPLTTMPQPFAAPYGLPPPYPYYPYYIPSYPMAPYPYASISVPNDRIPLSSKAAPVMGPPMIAPPFYPYPYPPQPYDYTPGLPGIPFLPPRYTAAPGPGTYTQPYTEQPLFSGIPPAPGPIPGYACPPISVSDPPRTLIVPAAKRSRSPSPGPIRVDVKRDGNFNHYHYEVKESASAVLEKRRKRVRQESEYLTSYQNQIAVTTSSVPSSQVTEPTNINLPTKPATSDESTAQLITVPSVRDTTRTDMNGPADRGTNPPGSPKAVQSAARRCFSRTCRRSIPTDVVGNICDKCKLKFKKHQVKAKQKFKLEPRKFLIDQNLSEKSHKMDCLYGSSFA